MNWWFIISASIIFYILSKKIFGDEKKKYSFIFTLYLIGTLYVYKTYFSNLISFEPIKMYSLSESV